MGEPQIKLNVPSQLSVRQSGLPVASFGRPLADYMTLVNLLQPSAALAANGVITGGDVISQATNALVQLHQAGYQMDSDFLRAPVGFAGRAGSCRDVCQCVHVVERRR